MADNDRQVRLDLSGAQVWEALDAVADGITVQAPDGTLLLANQAAARMLGVPSAAELMAASPSDIARRFDLFDEHGEPMAPQRLPGRAALRGEEPPEVLVRWRLTDAGAGPSGPVRAGDSEHYSLVKARPVRDGDGRVLFAVNVFRDVTERQRALEALRDSEARLAFLAAASRRLLTTSLEPHAVLDQVAALVVPDLADWCVVRDVDEEERVRSVLISEVSAGPERPDQSGRNGPGGRDELSQHLAGLEQSSVRSLVTVPLRARDQTVGVLTLARGHGRRVYTEADRDLAEEFGARVAEAVLNARSYRRERATAEALARGLLPGRLPEIPGVQLAARYRATGDVGGDFYDCIPHGDGRWLLVVGDVCGRGIQAASMTGLTRHTIRAAALHAASPAAVLHDLNRLLVDAAGDMAWESDTGPSFCTVCLAEVTLDPGRAPGARDSRSDRAARASDFRSDRAARARVVVSSGGHPLPFVVRGDGRVSEIGRPGSLIGALTDLEVTEETIDLEPGDALVLFTDGITELRRKGRLFEEDLPAALRKAAGASADEVAGWVEEAALSYSSTVPDDDIAVLVLAIPAHPSPSSPSSP